MINSALATRASLLQILTDIICSKCSKVPLMRSPASHSVQSHLCVNCDDAPATSAPMASTGAPEPPRVAETKVATTSEVGSISSNSGGMSRSSTPPTEVSDAQSSPALTPVMDTAELLRRRRQSDAASAEIGKRMLKGWAMLADECPNSGCYGIPLVRPPKAGTSVDPRKASNLTTWAMRAFLNHRYTGMCDLCSRLRRRECLWASPSCADATTAHPGGSQTSAS